MCGPSKAMKALNADVQAFTKQITTEATTVFQGANDVFNTIVGSLKGIVQGGPSQQGFGAAELNAKNASAVQQGATMARNLAGAAGSSAAAIGGGNAATPGTILSAELGAKTAAANATAQAENTIQQQNYETGRENFFKAEGDLQKAPGVFDASAAMNKGVGEQQTAAMKSQQNMDTQNNWWQPIVEKVAGAGLSLATGGAVPADILTPGGGGGGGISGGGFGNLDSTGGSSPWEQVKNFMGTNGQ